MTAVTRSLGAGGCILFGLAALAFGAGSEEGAVRIVAQGVPAVSSVGPVAAAQRAVLQRFLERNPHPSGAFRDARDSRVGPGQHDPDGDRRGSGTRGDLCEFSAILDFCGEGFSGSARDLAGAHSRVGLAGGASSPGGFGRGDRSNATGDNPRPTATLTRARAAIPSTRSRWLPDPHWPVYWRRMAQCGSTRSTIRPWHGRWRGFASQPARRGRALRGLYKRISRFSLAACNAPRLTRRV